MRILVGNTIYDFTVAQDDAVLSPNSSAADEFQVDLKFRSPETELRRSLHLSRSGSESSMIPLMADILEEFDVPAQARSDMATHFRFYLERLSRRNLRRRGTIAVAVSLDVKVMAPERAAAIQSRMVEAAGRRENRRPARAETAAMAVPAKKSAVEALERERVGSEDEERECSICLERVEVGAEVIRMPCLHLYHKDCIVRWLERTHFCPFCRYKLPY